MRGWQFFCPSNYWRYDTAPKNLQSDWISATQIKFSKLVNDWPSITISNRCWTIIKFHNEIILEVERVNDTHLFSRTHQTSFDLSFLRKLEILHELQMVSESDSGYDTLLVGKTKEFGKSLDFHVSLGNG